MRCEKCGAEINSLEVNIFNYDGSDSFWREDIHDHNGYIELETTSDWTGYDCGYDIEDTIRCPKCHEFPFNNGKAEVCDVVKIYIYKK